MSRLRSARPDRLAVTGAAGAIMVAVVLALLLPGVGLKFVGALSGMAIAYVITKPAGRLLMERAAKKYRDFVIADPTLLFPRPPDVESAALESRPRLTSSIAEEVARQRRDGERRPILVVGEAGSGKTTFAAGLAVHLARTGHLPVIVPLRGRGDEIDFETAGRDRFQELVRLRQLAKRADTLWDYLRKSDRCVVIADGLDERVLDSRAGEVTEATAEILSSDAAFSIPLVVTSRPDGLPRAQLVEALWLEELAENYVASLLVEDSKGSVGEREAREIARRLELTLRPLFLRVARDIGSRASSTVLAPFATANDTDLARYRLLDARLDVFTADDPGIRSQTVDTVSVLALVGLCGGEARASATGQDGSYEEWLQAIAGPPLNRSTAIAAGTDLRFLRIEGETVRFRHPIIQTYLASRGIELLRGTGVIDPEWGPLLEVGTSDEVLRALRMYATRLAISENADAAERIELLTRDLLRYAQSDFLNPTQRLSVRASAAQALGSAAAAQPGAFEVERAELARLIESEWDIECHEATKVEAIRWLARMSGEEAFRSVWSIGLLDDNYAFRWEVVEAIAEVGAAATAALRRTVEPMLDACSPWIDDPDAPDEALPEGVVWDLGLAAKFLPSGNEAGEDTTGAGLDSPAAADLTARIARAVRAMTERERGLGVEASLAQGLKHAARRYPLTDENLAEARELVVTARFWYTRIMAIHALVRHAVAVEDKRLGHERPDDVVNSVDDSLAAALGDDHPWVKEAAAHGRRALEHVRRRDTDTARGFVWHDEAGQIARSSHELDDSTSRLLADVVLELNMNEQGCHGTMQDGQFVRHARDAARVPGCETCAHQLEVGTSNALPHCLSTDRDRSRLLVPERACTCSFRLCPYDFAAYREIGRAHRGQLSPPFCAAQRGIARQLGPPPWQSQMSVEACVAFWEAMRENA